MRSSSLSLSLSLTSASHRFPSEQRSLARHRRNFNSIKSLQVLRDSDHGEYLFLPAVCGPIARIRATSARVLFPGFILFRPPFPSSAKATRNETIIGEVGNYRMTPLAFAVVCDAAPDANLKCRHSCTSALQVAARRVYTRCPGNHHPVFI